MVDLVVLVLQVFGLDFLDSFSNLNYSMIYDSRINLLKFYFLHLKI